MGEALPPGRESGVDDFLIAEYEHLAESFWRTEELGEKRLNFLISLLTATVAGLTVLATSDSGFSDAQVQWLTFAAGLALLLFGCSTLLRMLQRNKATDQYKYGMRVVRENFSERYSLVGYDPFAVPAERKAERPLFTGGLAQTVALLNSTIAAALAAIALLLAASAAVVALAAAFVFVASLVVQFTFIHSRHRRG